MLIIDNDFKSEVSIKGSLKTFIAETIGTGAVLASVTKMATVPRFTVEQNFDLRLDLRCEVLP